MFVDNEEESFQGKGMFAGVGRYAKQKHFCKGIDCRFSYKNIGEKADVVGYCLWCDSDKMQNAMEIRYRRDCIPKKGLQFFYDNDDDVFRMALTRLPVEYRSFWPLKALGLPKRFHCEENVKAALADENTNWYRTFVSELGHYMLVTGDCITLSGRGYCMSTMILMEAVVC